MRQPHIATGSESLVHFLLISIFSCTCCSLTFHGPGSKQEDQLAMKTFSSSEARCARTVFALQLAKYGNTQQFVLDDNLLVIMLRMKKKIIIKREKKRNEREIDYRDEIKTDFVRPYVHVALFCRDPLCQDGVHHAVFSYLYQHLHSVPKYGRIVLFKKF